MALHIGEGPATGWLDQGLRAALGRRLGEVWGVGFLALGAVLGTCLLSYDPADPSHFSATGAAPANWLGRPGAVVADPLMRMFGAAAWFLAAFPAVWGMRFLFHAGEQRIWARALVAPAALGILAIFASTHAVPESWPMPVGLGGLVGDSGAAALLGAIPAEPVLSLTLLTLGLAFPVVVTVAAALGVTLAEAGRALSWMAHSLLATIGQFGGQRDGQFGGRHGGRHGGERDRPHVGRASDEGRMAPARMRPEAVPVLRAKPDLPEAEPRPARPRGRLAEITGAASAMLSRLIGAARSGARPGAKPGGRPGAREAEPAARAEPKVVGFPDRAPAGRAEPVLGPLRTDDEDDTHDGTDPSPPQGHRPLAEAIAALKSGVPMAEPEPEASEPDDTDSFEFELDEDDVLGVDREQAMARLTDGQLLRKTVSHPQRHTRKSRQAEREAQPALALDGLEAEQEEAYDAPPLALLQPPGRVMHQPVSEIALEENARMLETVLDDYGVRGEIVAVKPGPVVTLYELEPAPGLKASRVMGLADDIARSMSALSARVSTVPGRSVIGIELPNDRRETVLLRDVLQSAEYGDSRHPLALALGKDIEGTPMVVNLAKMPHLLIAGTTGSGKSVAINTMILSLLYRLGPEKCRLIMIDPKMLELSVYDDIPHLLTPVVTDPKKALVALKWVVGEMEERYRKMSRLGVRNIDGYNARVEAALAKGEEFERTVQTGFDEATGEPIYETETTQPEAMPLIVVIVDEMADLMMVAGKEIEACIQRLAQMARASGIHLIMATQRPSVDVITGTIKANFPTRISFQVTSKIDSRTILGEQGAEQLLGQGDMLYMAGGGRITRLHGPFVSDQEVEEVVRHLKSLGRPDYVSAVTDGGDEEMQATVEEKLGIASPGDSDDALYDKAVAIVARDRKCSTSYVQRKLQIGYNKAARLVELMEDQGVVSPANAVGKREILIEER